MFYSAFETTHIQYQYVKCNIGTLCVKLQNEIKMKTVNFIGSGFFQLIAL